MTPDQLAMAQLELSRLQLWITGLAIFLGPLAGVLFTFWFQAHRDGLSEKRRLFLFLMGHRKGLSVSPAMAAHLNTIDVVFHDSPTVRKAWRDYYPLLEKFGSQQQGHAWIELLSTMARTLKYPQLTQVEIDKFYVPEGHYYEMSMHDSINKELLRVLRSTQHLIVAPREGHDAPVATITDS